MTTLDCSGRIVQTDGQGYLLDGALWTPEVAESIARAAGMETLTDRHWKIIALFREDAARHRRVPSVERIVELSGYEVNELNRLFRDRPRELVARIAGLPKPSTDANETSDHRSTNDD